ncbi:MAG TPA: helix-turn-helix transcriptional regulator [Actinomycetes bacterium]|nr:helix-turn-helix transcriptional regulator [Actinomycetes bacterium]
MDDQFLLLLSPPVRWVHLLNTLLWPASALLGLWRARWLVRRRSKRAAYALVVVAVTVGAENLLQALSNRHPAGFAHLLANALLALAGAVALFVVASYGGELAQEERLLYALSRGRWRGAHGGKRPMVALSPREEEVLACLCRGWRTDEIARELCISPYTAATHVRNLRRKLRVSSREEAIGWAIRNEFYDPLMKTDRRGAPTEREPEP